MGLETESSFDGRLFELYTRYVTEPESRKDVYGYAVLFVGYVLGLGGVLIYLLGSSLVDAGSPAFLVREVATVLSAAGLVLALFGIVLMVPVKRRGIQAGVAGTLLALAGVVWFVLVYPQSWGGATPDYSSVVITVYTVGIGLVAGIVVGVPVVTGERGYFSEVSHPLERDHPAIMIGEAARGAVFAVYQQGSAWTWRLIDQAAVARSTESYLSRLETEERVDAVKERIAAAGLLEIKHAAFRLYEANGSWRWVLMRDDGSVVADSGDEFPARDAAEESVSVLKEEGPDAEVFTIEEAAFDYATEDGAWHWRLLDDERAALARSGAGYESRDGLEAGVDRFREHAPDASVVTIEAFGIELYEGDGDGDGAWQWQLLDAADTRLATSATGFGSRSEAETRVYDVLDHLEAASVLAADEPAYEVYQDADDGAWRWRLVTAGEETVARSHAAAPDHEAVESTASRMQAAVAGAGVVEADDEAFEVYETAEGWRWRLVTPDREVLARSTDAHGSAEAAERAVERLREQAPDADLLEFETAAFQLYETDDGGWRWRLIDQDGNVLADSGEGEYDSPEDAADAMATLQEYAPGAERLEIDTAAFELFQDETDDWGWRLVDPTGETIAEGGTGHETRDDAKAEMAALVDRVSGVEGRVMDRAAFQVYPDDDAWRWRFVQPDGTVLGESPGTFATRHEAEDAIADLVDETAGATVATVGRLAVQLVPADEEWSWRLIDQDRTPVATSTATYDSREAAEAVVADVQEHASTVTVFDIRGAAFLLTREAGWRWRLLDEAHAVLARGPGDYETRDAARDAVRTVASLAPDATLLDFDGAAFELYEEDGWRWRLVDERGDVMADSAEAYDARADAEREVEAIKTELDDASILEIETAAFELHEADGVWRWRLIDETGNVLAESLASYSSRRGARDAMNRIQEHAPDAWTSVAG